MTRTTKKQKENKSPNKLQKITKKQQAKKARAVQIPKMTPDLSKHFNVNLNQPKRIIDSKTSKELNLRPMKNVIYIIIIIYLNLKIYLCYHYFNFGRRWQGR
jgi:hypothetical protein